MAREEFDIYNFVHKNKFKLKVDKPKTQAYKTATSWTPFNEVKIVDGKFSIMESLEATNDRTLATDVKRHFLEIISTYTSFQEQMKRNSDIVDIAETLGGVVEAAKTLTLQEAGDWFDRVTVKRNMTELDKLDKSFDKVAVEARALDQRLHALYEDMGNILGRYYEISDLDPAVMKNRLGIKDTVTESVYTVKVSNGGNSLGKKKVVKSELKEAVSKLKSKYTEATITVINENGKVVKTINPTNKIYSNGFISEEILNERFGEKIMTALLILVAAGGIAHNVRTSNIQSTINNNLKAGKEVVIEPNMMKRTLGDTFSNYNFTNPYTIKVDSTQSKPVAIDTAANTITLKTAKLDNDLVIKQLKSELGIKTDANGNIVAWPLYQNVQKTPSGVPLSPTNPLFHPLFSPTK